jgi:hypothetical protein
MLKPIGIAGWLKDVNDNFESIMPIGQEDGFGVERLARFTFDVEGVDSAGEPNAGVGAHGVGLSFPAHAIIIGGFFDVNTPFTSENASNATIAIKVEGANDIVSAAAVSGAPYSTKGRKAIVPKANTPESTSVKTTVAREITVTVATSELLTGKLTGYLKWVPGIISEDLPTSS